MKTIVFCGSMLLASSTALADFATGAGAVACFREARELRNARDRTPLVTGKLSVDEQGVVTRMSLVGGFLPGQQEVFESGIVTLQTRGILKHIDVDEEARVTFSEVRVFEGKSGLELRVQSEDLRSIFIFGQREQGFEPLYIWNRDDDRRWSVNFCSQ